MPSSTSTVTYEITLYNNSNQDYVYIGEQIDENAYSNENIGYTINGLTKGVTTIAPKASLTFTITFAFIEGADTSDNVLESIINFRFKELPIIDLSNENETYTLENIYPGYTPAEYQFTVANYTETDTNYIPMTYSFETTIDSPIQAKIYDENETEVTGKINLKGDGTTEEHTYTLRIIWDAEDTEYEDKDYKCKVKLIAKPTDEKYVDYQIVKEFNINPITIKTGISASDIASNLELYKGATIYGYDPNISADGTEVGASYSWPTTDGYLFNSDGYLGLWKILGVEGDNILITTSRPIYPIGETSFRLGDGTSYDEVWNNYQTNLNEASKIYGKGKYAAKISEYNYDDASYYDVYTGRNMNLSDLGLTDNPSKETISISASTNLITELYTGENKEYFLYDKFEDVSYCNHSGAYFGEYYVSGADMSVARNICVAEYYDENDEFQLDYNYLSNVYAGLRPVITLEADVRLEEIDENTYKIVGTETPKIAIPISTVEQLLKIGSNEEVTINGKTYTFSNDANYILQNDLTFEVSDYMDQYPDSFGEGTTTIENQVTNYTTANSTSNPYYIYTAPATGTYTLEVWGAGGGWRSVVAGTGGLGGYSVGTITLNGGDNLYVYVGQKGGYTTSSSTTAVVTNGYNGGGGATYYGGTGGGATDIRFTAGTWNDSTSLLSRVIVAGGGGRSTRKSRNFI